MFYNIIIAKIVAWKLGLKDLGPELLSSQKKCEKCGTQLRLGEKIIKDFRKGKVAQRVFAYCPKCKKISHHAREGRQPPIKFEKSDD